MPTETVGWAVKRVESKAREPRFQVGTIRGVIGYEPASADDAPMTETERRLADHREWEAKQVYRWEWSRYYDRSEATLALWEKGFSEVEIGQFLDVATANPGKSARHMLDSDTIEVV